MKLKKFFLFAALIALLWSCQKDAVAPIDLQEEDAIFEMRDPDTMYKYIVTNLEVISDPSAGLTVCGTDAAGWVEGHITHLGLLQGTESPWIITSCEMDFSSVPFKLINQIDGFYTAANGDQLIYHGVMTALFVIDPNVGPIPLSYSSNETILDGTGRFENATGYIFGGGVWENGVLTVFPGEGLIKIPK